ncbi:PAS domain S-box protein [Chondrinema litorale]|uniref:PAS domain S-box protein n=1 Tax=Chondrinema litorale TaxID=2994555 RepID=UPI002542A8E5|nr:PAS domain S-box protein [Chondrinema litorale]UZR97420.1 PAS domain S-box protein [Chondrinema litorale]
MRSRTKHPTNGLRKIYVLALSIIAIIIIFSQLLIHHSILKLSSDAGIINIAGRQRMLSQKIAKLALIIDYAEFNITDSKKELKEVFELWEKVHFGLQYGDSCLHLKSIENTASIQNLFSKLNPHFKEIQKSVNILVDTHTYDSTTVAKSVHTILANEKDFLSIMDQIVNEYEFESNNKIRQLEKIEFSLLLVALLILAIEGLFIFRPVINALDRNYLKLKDRNRLLKIQQNELQKQKSQLKDSNEELENIKEELMNQAEEMKIMNESLSDKNTDLEISYNLLVRQKKELKLLSQVAEEVSNGVIITDKDGKAEWVNKGFSQISGYTLKDIIGKKPEELLQGDEINLETKNHICKFLKQKIPFFVEFQCYHRLGLPYWSCIQITPIFDEKGEVDKYIYVQQDITEHKNVEERTRKHNQELLNFQEELSEAYAFQSALFNSAAAIIIATDTNGIITSFNKTAEKFLGYNAEEVINKQTPALFFDSVEMANLKVEALNKSVEVENEFGLFTAQLTSGNNTFITDINFVRKNGNSFPVSLSIASIKNEVGEASGYIVIAEDISDRRAAEKQLKQSFETIQTKNKHITDSINYAQRIQNSILPKQDLLQDIFSEYFVFFRPKDVVSGDFYWATTRNDKIILAAVDCTGHGVPGAFMSLIGNTLLNKIINGYGITEPDEILELLHSEVVNTLHQNQNGGRDGMDMSLCTITPSKKTIAFAGARNPLYLIKDNEMMVIKGNRKGVGGQVKSLDNSFDKHVITYENEVSLYLFSDGYQDQFGGEEQKVKLGQKRMRSLIEENAHRPMQEQLYVLKDAFIEWKQSEKQIDDVLVLGAKIAS